MQQVLSAGRTTFSSNGEQVDVHKQKKNPKNNIDLSIIPLIKIYPKQIMNLNVKLLLNESPWGKNGKDKLQTRSK